MFKRALILVAALALCMGLCSCYEPSELDPTVRAEPIPDMKVVTDGSFTATVVGKEDDGITLEVTNSENSNKVSATFNAVKISGKEYSLNQATYDESPVSITRTGVDGKTMNLSLPPNDFARIKVSCSELSRADDYNNVDVIYSETYMSDNGPVTKTGKRISIKNA